MLAMANGHMLRGGSPVKKMRTSEKIPLMMTCHPMAIYFSSELLSKKFHIACMDAETNKRIKALIGIYTFIMANPYYCHRLIIYFFAAGYTDFQD